MKIKAFKLTSDDWYPSYELAGWHEGKNDVGLVEVIFTQTGPNPPIKGQWRVCVWGADDCGMEKDFNDQNKAMECFLSVLKLEDVTMNALRSLGFVNA